MLTTLLSFRVSIDDRQLVPVLLYYDVPYIIIAKYKRANTFFHFPVFVAPRIDALSLYTRMRLHCGQQARSARDQGIAVLLRPKPAAVLVVLRIPKTKAAAG